MVGSAARRYRRSDELTATLDAAEPLGAPPALPPLLPPAAARAERRRSSWRVALELPATAPDEYVTPAIVL